MLDNYKTLNTGAIKQINVAPFVYDEKYVQDRYDAYGVQCDMMSFLRYGFITGSIGRKMTSVLDVGYGNGSFLKICKSNEGTKTFGTDVSNYPLSHGQFINFDEVKKSYFDIITFFDSLEHFTDISFLKHLQCNYVCITVPNCSYNAIKKTQGEDKADAYFKNWKHRRENEHIWHFDVKSLDFTMRSMGYELFNFEYVEDIIRKRHDEYPNILTAIFKK